MNGNSCIKQRWLVIGDPSADRVRQPTWWEFPHQTYIPKDYLIAPLRHSLFHIGKLTKPHDNFVANPDGKSRVCWDPLLKFLEKLKIPFVYLGPSFGVLQSALTICLQGFQIKVLLRHDGGIRGWYCINQRFDPTFCQKLQSCWENLWGKGFPPISDGSLFGANSGRRSCTPATR